MKPIALRERRTLGKPDTKDKKKVGSTKLSLPIPPPTASWGVLDREQLAQIQERIGVLFRNLRVLEQAFIHSSFLNEIHMKSVENNERIEFLGDKMLGMVLGQYLFRRLPDADEGEMTQIFHALSCNKMLARVTEELKLTEFLLMSKGQRKEFDNNYPSRPHILACMFEALVGALYLDRGVGAVEIFLDAFLFPKIEMVIMENQIISAKSKLQELVQEKFRITPHYDILFEQGPDHEKMFTAGALIGDRCVGRGEWMSKAGAENAAARDALTREFGITLPDNPILT